MSNFDFCPTCGAQDCDWNKELDSPEATLINNFKDRVSRLELHLSRCLLDIEHSDKWYEREEAYEKRYAEALALVRGGR
jgi:hypothetical protein